MDQDSKCANNIIDIYMQNEREDVIIYSPKYLIERKKEKKYKKDTIEMYWTMTSGNLLNLEMYQKVGKFKEELFIDAVDYEYCLRARRKKFKILQCNEALLIHNPGITKEKKILGLKYKYGFMSEQRMYYQVRNLMYIGYEYKCIRALIIVLVKYLKIVLLFENKKNYFKAFHKGIKDYKKNIKGKYIQENG